VLHEPEAQHQRGEKLARLVVKLARDPSPLRLLRFDELARHSLDLLAPRSHLLEEARVRDRHRGRPRDRLDEVDALRREESRLGLDESEEADGLAS